MARWKLVTPHYLHLTEGGAEWEYKEINRQTGRPKSTKFKVPTLLDPTDPTCWNHQVGRDDGMVVVTNGGSSQPNDYIFSGSPTPDMVPMDEEAEKITAAMEKKWNITTTELKAGYSDKLVQDFESEIQKLKTEIQPQVAKVEGMDALVTALTAVMKQNEAIITTLLANQAQPAEQPGRRA